MLVNNINVKVNKKNIKNVHLSVMPPDGHVVLSCPASTDDKMLEIFVKSKSDFIEDSINKFKNQKRQSKRQFVSGETIYLWGTPYRLKFINNEKNNKFYVKNSIVYLEMKDTSKVIDRYNFIKKQYVIMLKNEIEKVISKWERITGIKSNGYKIRYMKTKWGSNINGILIFNTQLAEKSIISLDYVVLHELLHNIYKTHNKDFIKDLEKYLPNWESIKNNLNDEVLDYINY